MLRLLHLVCQAPTSHAPPVYTFPVPLEIRGASANLARALTDYDHSHPDHSNPPTDDDFVHAEPEPDEFDDSDDKDAQDHYVPDATPVESGHPYGAESTAPLIPVDIKVQLALSKLLTLIYKQTPKGMDHQWFSPIMHYILLFSLRENGVWDPPGNISQHVAAFTCIGRHVFGHMIHEHMERHPDHTVHQ